MRICFQNGKAENSSWQAAGELGILKGRVLIERDFIVDTGILAGRCRWVVQDRVRQSHDWHRGNPPPAFWNGKESTPHKNTSKKQILAECTNQIGINCRSGRRVFLVWCGLSLGILIQHRYVMQTGRDGGQGKTRNQVFSLKTLSIQIRMQNAEFVDYVGKETGWVTWLGSNLKGEVQTSHASICLCGSWLRTG